MVNYMFKMLEYRDALPDYRPGYYFGTFDDKKEKAAGIPWGNRMRNRYDQELRFCRSVLWLMKVHKIQMHTQFRPGKNTGLEKDGFNGLDLVTVANHQPYAILVNDSNFRNFLLKPSVHRDEYEHLKATWTFKLRVAIGFHKKIRVCADLPRPLSLPLIAHHSCSLSTPCTNLGHQSRATRTSGWT